MNRVIKFRGIREEYNPDLHESIFKYGNLLNANSIGEVGYDLSYYKYAKVKSETVGQFTGLHDKNGKEIYEGDILKGEYTLHLKVVFENGAFCFENEHNSGSDRLHQDRTNRLEVIGNIYETPQLI